MPTKRVEGRKKLKSIKSKQREGKGSKQRLAKLGKEQKKGLKGSAVNYLTRSQALKRLQISLKDFRKLCILKGIYPRDPKKKANGNDKTYYYFKDIYHLSHEPLLQHFREFKTFMKKIKRAMGKQVNQEELERRDNTKPKFDLAPIVKERYPSFIDAVRDLDDALCLLHLFAKLPVNGNILNSQVTEKCLRLVREWENYIVISKSLKKTFVSIKGIYYQASIMGQQVTWLVPHNFNMVVDNDVDLKVMVTFLEFYMVLVKFVHFKLYADVGVIYPPKIDLKLDNAGAVLRSIVNKNVCEGEDEKVSVKKNVVSKQERISKSILKNMKDVKAIAGEDMEVDEEQEEEVQGGDLMEPLEKAFEMDDMASKIFKQESVVQEENNLFHGLVFFLSREVPLPCLELVIKSFGGSVGYEGEGSPYDEKSNLITHHVMDRPHQGHRYFNREYIQPQWILDSVNAGMKLPLEKYVPGAALPPHLSPFVDDEMEGYTPEYKTQLNALKSAKDVLNNVNDDTSDDDEEEDEEEEYEKDLQEERIQGGLPKPNSDSEEDESDDEMEPPQQNVVEKKRPAPEMNNSAVKLTKKAKKEQEEKELKELSVSMMSKKAKRLYDRMHHGIGLKSAKREALEKKRKILDDKK